MDGKNLKTVQLVQLFISYKMASIIKILKFHGKVLMVVIMVIIMVELNPLVSIIF